MNYSTKYAILTKLPLLQGISGKDLAYLEEKLKLDVEEFPALKTPLFLQDSPCTHLIFLIEGQLKRIYQSTDKTYRFITYIDAPAVIEAYRLFGLNNTYSASYQPSSDVQMICIRKYDVSTYLLKTDIFRLNFLNHISSVCGHMEHLLLPHSAMDVKQKFFFFLKQHLKNEENKVTLEIKMVDLAKYLGERRLTVSQLLNKLQEENLLHIGRAHINIPDLQKLFNQEL